jgi:phage gpG-like protein
MSAIDNKRNIESFFNGLTANIREKAPTVIAETAVEYYKESIITGKFDGVPFKPLSQAYLKAKRRNRDKVLYLNGLLWASIRPAEVSADRVVISAGSSKVPYARIHNEGGVIVHNARSETFVRNRHASGKRKGLFKKGTKPGQGHQYRSYTVNIPQRRFMGYAAELNERIMNRLKQEL